MDRHLSSQQQPQIAENPSLVLLCHCEYNSLLQKPDREVRMKTEIIVQRLDAIRAEMEKACVDAFVIPHADEYLGEYIPARNERLQWASGFTGSAGLVVVLPDRAAIFVDGRYTIQVRQQVPESLFEFHHLVEEPQAQWLLDTLSSGSRVGYDPRLHSLKWQSETKARLAKKQIELQEVVDNPIDLSWDDRPAPGKAPAMLLDDEYTGQNSMSKRQQIGKLIEKKGADSALISQLDSIAWLLNIRGSDVTHVPVLLGFSVLGSDGQMALFTDLDKLPDDIENHVGAGVTFHDEATVAAALEDLGKQGSTVIADPETSNAWCQLLVTESGGTLIADSDPVLLPKAQKNATELAGMKDCHINDAAAEIRFLAWLDKEVTQGNLHDEALLSDTLGSFRLQQEGCMGLSFDTISAAGSNGAMCHYNHLNATPAKLELNNLYLVDSGGQYLTGTTDITRTVIIGEPSDDHKRMFTLVLKGHIALDQARFPVGTTGSQLDILARQFLWQEGFDYDHGTGHGVGCFLSVHEGPQRISKVPNTTALKPGMVVSNEPGYYKEDCYGIRCENLLAVKTCGELSDAETPMLEFEALTLVPFDLRLVEASMLTGSERLWLNDYHARVRENLAPLLGEDDQIWLQQATEAV
jgi:Xaa-Pro aminopeptidase